MSDLPAILLAAGGSTRMRGADKLLEEVNGVPLLRRQAARLCAATRGTVIVTLPPAPHPRDAALDGLDVKIVRVADPSLGMNASLSAGVVALPDARAALVALADMPDLEMADFARVLAAVDDSATRIWRACTENGAPGHPIAFHRDLWPALRALTGDTGGRAVVQAHAHVTRMIPLPGTRARTDLDTPEAWAAWRAT
ncbi:nucleotidyltransferase family protein [Sulfitobacter albidus]|uniref:Nucleotidyltransferase family protein n=1 Tax=Sulfitobacter albidus TaxID=2829501 RepID=A0A975JFJ5_9RHOB|nr:nucleotidyltransferase family protein [Sulfitobacter albidus]QUJ77528.1 nucleotidyltransferase family protein [Sulfitobacter albidus]